MPDLMIKPDIIPKSSLFRWEIGAALLFKVVLLTGLWFLIFQWPERPARKPDIAAHLLPANGPAATTEILTAQPQQEVRYVR